MQALLPCLGFFLLITFNSANADFHFAKDKFVPPDNEVLREFKPAPASALPEDFRILVWNIYKSESGDPWAKDFTDLSKSTNIFITQEALWNNFSLKTLAALPGFSWIMATSFVYEEDGAPTGVMTGATHAPVSSQYSRSRSREPIVKTPKMTLFTRYHLQGRSQQLTVANIHGMNVVFNKTFRDQIEDVANILGEHNGPIIFAGDFNTWNIPKKEYLITRLRSIGLTHLNMPVLRKGKWLDHIFYRDLELIEAKALEDITSSDHLPIAARFRAL